MDRYYTVHLQVSVLVNDKVKDIEKVAIKKAKEMVNNGDTDSANWEISEDQT